MILIWTFLVYILMCCLFLLKKYHYLTHYTFSNCISRSKYVKQILVKDQVGKCIKCHLKDCYIDLFWSKQKELQQQNLLITVEKKYQVQTCNFYTKNREISSFQSCCNFLFENSDIKCNKNKIVGKRSASKTLMRRNN